MMKVLLKSALIHDPTSALHGKRRDVLLQGNRMLAVSTEITDSKAKIVQGKDCIVSRGWTDLTVRCGEPGDEYKEDFSSLRNAALRGGFTRIALLPSVRPVADTKSAIRFVTNHSTSELEILPIGAISQRSEGKQLAEMFDMQQTGAAGFSDDRANLSTELMCRALEYTRNLNSVVMALPWDRGLNGNGQMHEGAVSVSLGMKGIPAAAEEIRVQRDIELLRYCGGRLHFMLISTARSVELIRKAKRDGLAVTCAVAAHQLLFTDEHLRTFDSNYKVIPPFRSKDDRKALIAGLKDGTIDAIVSDHSPEDVEHKVREFEDAHFGISSIESTFCTAFTALEKYMTAEEIIEKFTTGPEQVLGLSPQTIADGNNVPVSVLFTESNTEFTPANWQSKSKNSPVLAMTLRGAIHG
jgi:dihydroorotase